MRRAKTIMLIVAAALCGLAQAARAESMLWSGVYNGQLYIPPPPSFQPVLNYPSMSVQYHATAVDTASGADVCDSTIQEGTRVTFTVTPGTRQDIVWNGTGNGIGTPYGFFYADAQYPFAHPTLTPGDGTNICSPDNWYAYECSSSGCFNQYATFSVAPPSHSITTGNGFSCDAPRADGSITCTATTAGLQQNTFTIDTTYGTSASVDPKGVFLGWVGLGLSLMISILGAATIRTSSQGPVFLLLLLALMGAVISETLVSLCMAAAFFSGLLATGGRVSIPLPSYGKPTTRIRIPIDYDGKKLRSRSV